MVRSRVSIFARGRAAGSGAHLSGAARAARAGADGNGDQVQGEGEREEDEDRRVEERPRRLDVGRLRREHVGVVAEVHELRDGRVGQVGQEVGDAGEQDRRDLARAARDREDGAGEDAGERAGEDDAPERLRAGGAEREARVAVVARDGAQRLLGRDDDDRQRQDRERQRGPDERGLAVAERRPAPRRPGPSRRPTNWMKKPRPNRPKTIDGTPARFVTATRTSAGEPRARRRVLVEVDRGQRRRPASPRPS